ncbi:MAG TPA: DUF5666 domain-containing protein [Terriglobales bacterium]|nr:DUF5666 domain-containing protein [Terriglobales bacterium]
MSLQLAVAQNPAGATGAPKNSSDAAKTPNSSAPESHENSSVPNADAPNQESNPGDPLLDVPPLPKGKVTLVGGRVGKIDSIGDRIVVEPFGGGKIKVFFDERTHIYRDETETTQANIHKGDRVYVDTMLDGPRVFARNIRVVTRLLPTDASGQVLSYDRRSGVIVVNDLVSAQPVSFSVGPQTVVRKQDNAAGSADDLREGSLVAVRFSPGTGHRGAAQQVSILAVPGTTFTFAGKVTHLDMRTGLIAVDNQSDHKTYDIAFDPAKNKLNDDITVGSQVQIVATFTGKGYQVENISSMP